MEIQNFLNIFLLIYMLIQGVFSGASDDLKCLVCQRTVREISQEIRKEDPRKKVETGSFRIEPDGSQKQSQIQYAASEPHLYDVLETICEKMSDYAQVKHKETGKKALIKLTEEMEMLSTHELVPTTDLNQSLKFYCETFAEEYEDDIIKAFYRNITPDTEALQSKLCEEVAEYCSAKEDHDEL